MGAQREDAFERAFKYAADAADLGDDERTDFQDWLQQHDAFPDDETVSAWRQSDEYAQRKFERLADCCDCDGKCTCTYDGERLDSAIPGLACDFFDADSVVAEVPSSALPNDDPVPAYLLDRGEALQARDATVPTYICFDAAMEGCKSGEDRRWTKEHLQRMAQRE